MRSTGVAGGGSSRGGAGVFWGSLGGCPYPGEVAGASGGYSARTSAPCDSNGARKTSAHPAAVPRTASTTAPVCS